MKITPPEKGDTGRGEIFLSPRRVSPFLARGDFHARSRFARSTTTRSLEFTVIFLQFLSLGETGNWPLNRWLGGLTEFPILHFVWYLKNDLQD